MCQSCSPTSGEPCPIERVYVIRLSHYELAVVMSAIVGSSDQIVNDMPQLDPVAYREAAKMRAALDAVLGRCMDTL